jgi:hypothetical protein
MRIHNIEKNIDIDTKLFKTFYNFYILELEIKTTIYKYFHRVFLSLYNPTSIIFSLFLSGFMGGSVSIILQLCGSMFIFSGPKV